MEPAKKRCPSVVIRRTIHASRDRVYEAWTNPESLSKWLCPKDWTARAENDLKVGGKYSVDMICGGTAPTCKSGGDEWKTGDIFPHTGEYLELDPPKKIVCTWNSKAVENTVVTIELIENGDATDLVLTHDFIQSESERESHSQGWNECISHLEQVIN